MGAQIDDIWLTFNAATIATAIITGLLFGAFAFMPLIGVVVPDETRRPATGREAFVGTFVVIAFVLGAIVTVFYAEQVTTEIIVNLFAGGEPTLPWRAVGRFLTFACFDLSFAAGVAISVWREYHH